MIVTSYDTWNAIVTEEFNQRITYSRCSHITQGYYTVSQKTPPTFLAVSGINIF